MEDNNISAPLPQAEAETQSPPVPAETTAVKVEVTVAGTVENLHANGSRDGGGEAAEDGGDGESGGVVGPEVTIRRKRGRPRKHHQLGSPDSSASPVSLGPKRGRGRPPGSGKLQMLASLGELGDTAGGNFTPYALAIQTGVDIAGVLSSFAQKGARSFCILSAVGCVSIVDICPTGYFGCGILRFKA
ncbi:AT-hook motif nuclear-localized protein 9-like [Rhododendron vialii]|uniref:AT-hook motif nuclear-localized protein 9-like n=1 Tax=Rhododendron vialii TaxID=182163 RepID=UPI00265F1477|nr:AT-hook motif nuclear-localized protein 9-like [Rhododendron vialii]